MHDIGDGKGHSHHHHHESKMPFEEQLKTLFEHWINHNASHAGTYKDWAAKAASENLPETAKLLEEVAQLTDIVSDKIREAADSLEE